MIVSNRLPIIKASLIALFMIAFLLKAFLPLAFLPTGMAVIATLVFGIGLKDLKPLNRNMISLLLLFSGVLIWSGQGPFNWSQAIIENAGIVTLLLTAPMLGAILYYAPYEVVLAAFSNRYIKTSYAFYVIIMAFVAFCCSLMSLAAIPFTNQLFAPVTAKYPAGIVYRALTRGFAVNLYWSPNLITVAVVLQYVNISWQELAPVGMIFSILSLIAICITGKFDLPSNEPSQSEQSATAESEYAVFEQSNNKSLVVLLIMQVVLILGALMVLTRYGGKSIYVTMAIIAVILPFLFAVAFGKVRIYRQRLSDYVSNTLPAMSNEFMLFLTIGFFGYALAQSPVIAVVQSQLAQISGYSPTILVLMIIATIGGVSITGVHPIITISSLAIALGKVDIGLSSIQLAITLITGYVMYLLLSPFSSMVMIMSGLFGQNVYTMGLRLNWRYALVLSLLVTFAIYVWRQL